MIKIEDLCCRCACIYTTSAALYKKGNEVGFIYLALLHRLTTFMLIALDIKTRYYCGPLTRGLNKRQKARPDSRVTCVRNAEGKSWGRR